MRIPAPMLATAAPEFLKGAAFDDRYADGWILEEKINGHRCLVHVSESSAGFGKVEGYSRPKSGRQPLRRRLPQPMIEVLQEFPEGIYDGELRTVDNTSFSVTKIGVHQVFIVFDVLQLRGRDLTGDTYKTRRKELLRVLRAMDARHPKQQSVSTVQEQPPTWTNLERIWARGGEGGILKHTLSIYHPGVRSPNWIKVKQLKSAKCRVTGYAPGKLGPYSILVMRDAKDIEVRVKTLDDHWRATFAANPKKYIGREFVIAYAEQTPSGKYFHVRWDHFAKED